MCPTQSLRRHADLVDRMALHLGIDLEEAVMHGQLPPGGLSDLVLNCKGCARTVDCAHLLDAAGTIPLPRADAAADAPYYCRNADVFDDLRRA